jgi:hypothetical protein
LQIKLMSAIVLKLEGHIVKKLSDFRI